MRYIKFAFILALCWLFFLCGCASEEERKFAHLEKGKAYFEKGKYKAALEVHPRKAGFHMAIGTIYDRLKQFDHAEQQYRRALEINPDFVPAANNLANPLAIHGTKLDEAMDLARKAKEKLPGDPC